MAALQMENLRMPARLSAKDRVQKASAEARRTAVDDENAVDAVGQETAVLAPSLALDFLDAGEHPRPQTTAQEAQAAYQSCDE
jgi:hypothetical protein